MIDIIMMEGVICSVHKMGNAGKKMRIKSEWLFDK